MRSLSFGGRLLGAGALLGLAACTLDQTALGVSSMPAQVVVHSVLDPGSTAQDVLVEKTLTGAVNLTTNIRFDPLDPINTGDGVPITGADVTLSGPDGILTGKEIKYPGRAASYGAGRYVIQAGMGGGKPPIRPGAQYTLTVRTAAGTTVTGTTVVPNVTTGMAPTLSCCQTGSFDRDRDTMRLDLRAATAARAYGLRVESPFGPFLLFSDSMRFVLPGNLRNLFASDLQRLFIPGFRQQYTVFAADSNYYDYYRSRNDPFTGSGIINHLVGGVGVFGSTAVLDTRSLDVTQDVREPAFEGNYEIVQTSRGYVAVMRLYVETPGTSAAVSGWYARDKALTGRDGIIGVRTGNHIELTFLVEQNEHRQLATFVGTVTGDSLVGTFQGVAGPVVFKRSIAQ